MALKTLQCCDDASSPQHWSVLRDIGTLNTPKKLYPLARGVVAHPFDTLVQRVRPHVGH
jgi:hypothetical protein